MQNSTTYPISYFGAFKRHISVLIDSNNRRFLYLALIYGLAVSLLTLAVPISVQMLINTVAHIASVQAILVLSLVLFGLLLFSGGITALQTYALELFDRRFYASMTAQFTLRNIYAEQKHFRAINGNDLVNRYFDIMQVQKVVPSLIAGFFATLLQMLVGIVLVSFYHPWLFLFNALFMMSLWMICRYWGVRAMATALDVSEAKYRTARHLEDIAQFNDFYKSSTRSHYAIARTDTLTRSYIHKRVRHFRNVFGQQIALLFLYALSSSVLLGLGGYLVVKAQLTLGQLVAAELILTAVFFGISRLGYYLVQFYDVTAAVEEIHRVYALPLEAYEQASVTTLPTTGVRLAFFGAKLPIENDVLQLDIAIEPNQKILFKSSSAMIQRGISDLLTRHMAPSHGRIELAGHDIHDIEPEELRNQVMVLDRTIMVESTIRNYLRISAPEASRSQMNDALRLVEMDEVLARLPNGIDSCVLANGTPLRSTEILRLKLAAALLMKPKILILNEYFDTISYERRMRIFKHLCEIDDMMLLYFSNRHDLAFFDRFVYLDWQQYVECAHIDALRACEQMLGAHND
jgi:ABC-type bacteriocin/lantibiotic exporter with double-glycine peptidase domain